MDRQYNRGVPSLGEVLRKIQGERTNIEIAERALMDATPAPTRADIRNFASYFSRIKWDKVPGVGVEQLALIAKGLNVTLSTIFLLVEGHERRPETLTHTTIDGITNHNTTEESSAEITTQSVGENTTERGKIVHHSSSLGARHAASVPAATAGGQALSSESILELVGFALLSAASDSEGRHRDATSGPTDRQSIAAAGRAPRTHRRNRKLPR